MAVCDVYCNVVMNFDDGISLEKTRDFCFFEVTRFVIGNLFFKMKSFFLEF